MAAAMQNTPFYNAIEKTLKSWTVLQLAVQNGFGGVDSEAKALWLSEATEQWFQENANIEPYELEDFLAEILDNEFSTVADDGSLPQIAEKVCKYFKLCQEGNHAELQNMLSKLPKLDLGQCQAEKVAGQEEDEEEDEGIEKMECSDSQASEQQQSTRQNQGDSHQMEEDDGWTVVHRSKRK